MAFTQADILAKTGTTYQPSPGVVVSATSADVTPVAGYVASAGTITAGSGGFTVSRTSAGVYKIALSRSVAGFSAAVVDTSPSSFTVVVFRTDGKNWIVTCLSSGTAADRDFSFVAF